MRSPQDPEPLSLMPGPASTESLCAPRNSTLEASPSFDEAITLCEVVFATYCQNSPEEVTVLPFASCETRFKPSAREMPATGICDSGVVSIGDVFVGV